MAGADGTGPAERLTKAEPQTAHVPESWSPSDDQFLYSVVGETHSLWSLSLKDRKAAPFRAIQSSQPIGAVFSPDGRWVAYSSNEAGFLDVFVQPSSGGAKYQVSKGGGHHPLWSPDGRELLWDVSGGRSDVTRITTSPLFTVGIPVALPRGSIQFGAPDTFRPVDMAPDGRIVGPIAGGQTQSLGADGQINIVVNWTEELKARVPTGR